MVGLFQGLSVGADITQIGSIVNSIFPQTSAQQDPYSFDRFSSIINKGRGLAPSNRFIFFITPPPMMRVNNHKISDIVPFLCHNINWPGIQFETIQYMNQGYGPSQHAPFKPTFNRLIANFYIDNNGGVINFFNNWRSIIMNMDNQPFTNSNLNGAYPYETYFHNDYVTEGALYIFDRTNELVCSVNFHEMWPFLHNDSVLSWNQHNSNLIIPYGFHYKDYDIITYGPQGNSDYSPGQSLGGAIQQLGQIVQEFSTFSMSRPLSMPVISTAITSGFGLL